MDDLDLNEKLDFSSETFEGLGNIEKNIVLLAAQKVGSPYLLLKLMKGDIAIKEFFNEVNKLMIEQNGK